MMIEAAEITFVNNELSQMISEAIVSLSASPYASEIHLVHISDSKTSEYASTTES